MSDLHAITIFLMLPAFLIGLVIFLREWETKQNRKGNAQSFR